VLLAAGAAASLALAHENPGSVDQTVTAVGFAVVSTPSAAGASSADFTLNYQASSGNPANAASTLTHDISAAEEALRHAGVAAADLSTPGGIQLNYFDTMSQQKCQAIEKLKHIQSLPGCPPQLGFQAMESLQAIVPISQLTKVLDHVRPQSLPGSPGLNVNIAQPASTAVPSPQVMAGGYQVALSQAKENASLLAKQEGLALGQVIKISQGVSGQLLFQPNGGGPSTVDEPQIGSGQQLIGVTVTYQLR
jgi:uncharacterized protein YggE